MCNESKLTDYWVLFPEKVVLVHLVDRKTLFVPKDADCPVDPASLDSTRTSRYADGKHHWQEFQDDWTGPDAHRILDFSWLGETIFQRRLDNVSVGGNDMQEWRETSANSARIPAMPRADAEEEEIVMARRDKIEEQPINPFQG